MQKRVSLPGIPASASSPGKQASPKPPTQLTLVSPHRHRHNKKSSGWPAATHATKAKRRERRCEWSGNPTAGEKAQRSQPGSVSPTRPNRRKLSHSLSQAPAACLQPDGRNPHASAGDPRPAIITNHLTSAPSASSAASDRSIVSCIKAHAISPLQTR